MDFECIADGLLAAAPRGYGSRARDSAGARSGRAYPLTIVFRADTYTGS